MSRYAAFLRGVSPMNLKMPELKRCLERAGFTDVKTLLSSGNVVFDASARSEKAILEKLEGAMQKSLGRTFYTLLRRVDMLQAMIQADPYRAFNLPPAAKRVVTFLPEAPVSTPRLPIGLDGAQILCADGREVFSAYVPSPSGPVFMTLIEKTFGTQVTTRTWDTVKKCASA